MAAPLLIWNQITRCRQHPSQNPKHGGPRVIDVVTIVMSENLDEWTMAQGLDAVADYSSSEKGQHTTLSELQNDQPE